MQISLNTMSLLQIYLTILKCIFFLDISVPALKVSHRFGSNFAAYMSNKNVLISAEEIEILVDERRAYRLERNFAAADNIKNILNNQHNIELVDWPHSTWKYIHTVSSLVKSDVSSNSTAPLVPIIKENLMWIARNAYNLLKSNKESEEDIVGSSLYLLHCKDLVHFKNSTKIKDMQGRKFADAAFEFSLAGINSNELFELLLNEGLAELKRYGYRSSCRPIDIFQVVEKLAVAGILNQSIYHLAGEIIRYKIEKGTLVTSLPYEIAVNRLTSERFSLFDDMPLLWLWRFSARQRKNGKQVRFANFSQEESRVQDIEDNLTLDISDSEALPFDEISISNEITYKLKLPLFDDPTLPLVIDIGCGFGVSILGLSYRETTMHCDKLFTGVDHLISIDHDIDALKKHNFLACDMSSRAISYASSISKRWGMHGKCCFINTDAESFLELIKKEYLGPVEGIMINFPTPYQFGADVKTINKSTASISNSDKISNDNVEICTEQTKFANKFIDLKEGEENGNAQLPKDMSDFMVTPRVIELCRQILENDSPLVDLSVMHEHDRVDIDYENDYSDNDNIMTRLCHKYLLIQTNVEDVAVTIKDIVTDSFCYDHPGGFTLPADSDEIQDIAYSWNATDVISSTYDNFIDPTIIEENDYLIQKRVMNWISSGGERAKGNGWLKSSPLPREGRTETEAMCGHKKKPVHRILFLIK